MYLFIYLSIYPIDLIYIIYLVYLSIDLSIYLSIYLGSHLITKNVHIPLSSTKRYFHGRTLFSRPFALCRLQFHVFHGFPRLFNVFPRPNAHFFTAKSCFHGRILIPRPNRFFEAIWPNGLWPPFSRSNGPPGILSNLI